MRSRGCPTRSVRSCGCGTGSTETRPRPSGTRVASSEFQGGRCRGWRSGPCAGWRASGRSRRSATLHSAGHSRIITPMATSVRSCGRALFRGPRSRSRPQDPEVTIQGSPRLGRRTKALVRRLGAADVAIIDHADLDRIAADDLLATGVPAVVNVAPFSTGRYPNAGPLTLAQGGVQLVEAPAAPLFEELRDGDPVSVTGGEIRRNGAVLAAGRVLSSGELTAQFAEQRQRIDQALADFAD